VNETIGGEEMSHTPIMLEVAFEPGKSIVIGNGELGIAIIPNDGGKREKERLANAHRITALWNAAERLSLKTNDIYAGAIYQAFDLLYTIERRGDEVYEDMQKRQESEVTE
jgi:hypothetical protein